MKKSFKFYGKDVNEGPWAPYKYIGSASIEPYYAHAQRLIDLGESIAGPVYGPMIVIPEDGEHAIVLKV